VTRGLAQRPIRIALLVILAALPGLLLNVRSALDGGGVGYPVWLDIPIVGIGLALARRLVEMHDGTIEGARDGPGLGSTLTLRLPISAAMPAPRPAVTETPEARVSRRVVVIDDNAQNANAMRRLVKALGGDCRVAYDGEAGVGEVVSFQPDLVFVDIGLPGIDGYEVARRLRRRPELSGLLIVAVTGYGQDSDRQRAREAGFDHHLVKPLDLEALRRLLADAPQLDET